MPLSLCAITGTVYTVGGIAAPGVTVYCHRVIKSGTLIESIQRLVATSDVNGAVSLSLPRAATAYLFAEAEGLDADEQNGTAFSIPDAASATLESLLPPTFPITQESFTFLALTDTPDTFVGQALKFPRVNAAETALEFAVAGATVTAEEIQDALVNFFPDVAPFDWTYDDAGDRVTLNILDATSGARGLMSTAYAARLDALEVGDSPTFAGLVVPLITPPSNVLRLANTTTPQQFEVYNTTDSNTTPVNYERGFARWSANIFEVGMEKAGTGALRTLRLYGNAIQFMHNTVTLGWQINSSGVLLTNGDNLYDIGQVGGSRPKSGYFGTSLIAGGAGGVGVIPLIAEGPSGQTANLFEARVNGTSLLAVRSTGALLAAGAWLRTGAGAVAQVLIQESGASAFAASPSGNGLGINSASGFTGYLINAQLNGAARFSVDSVGNVVANGGIQANSTTSIAWNARAQFTAPGDSQVRITNNGATGFQAFVLGPTVPSTIGAAPAQGQVLSILQASELLTIAAAATSTTTMQLPANAVVLAVSVRVTTVIPTAATFTVKVGAQVFSTAAVSTAANSTDPGSAAGAWFNATAQGVIITPDLTPGAATGVVRVTVVYYLVTPPTS